jgi:hypothetical protein
VTPPWWTAADQAELDVLLREWFDGAFEHRDKCAACLEYERVYGRQWCDALQESLEVILNWRERRSARSFAIAMRQLQDQIDNPAPSAADREEAA